MPGSINKHCFPLPLDKDELIIADTFLRDLCSLTKVGGVEGLLTLQVAQSREESGSSCFGYSLCSWGGDEIKGYL